MPLLRNPRITALTSLSGHRIERVIKQFSNRRLPSHSSIEKNPSLQPGQLRNISRVLGILGLNCFLLISAISAQSLPDTGAPSTPKPPSESPRQLAPPVHVAPGSITSQPVDRFRNGSSGRQSAGDKSPNSSISGTTQPRPQESPEPSLSDSGLQRSQPNRATAGRQLPSGQSNGNVLQTAGQGRFQEAATKSPQSVLITEPAKSSISPAAANPNRKRNRQTAARSQNVPIPSQVTSEEAQLVGHQADDPDEDLLIAMLEQSLDELWAENRSRHGDADGQAAEESPKSGERPGSVLDWEDSSLPTFSDPDSNPILPARRGIPQLIPNSSTQINQFRENLEELEMPAERKPVSSRRGLRSLIQDPEEIEIGRGGLSDEEPANLLDRSCEYYRGQLFSTRIEDIELDLSPPRSTPNSANQDAASQQRAVRNWTDRSGAVIATGKLVDMQRGYVILDNGQRIAYGRLGEPDLIVIADDWNLPRTCGVASRGDAFRAWAPMTYAYTASSVCHKPLYFENIQLERYGHSHGPLLQPIHSVAHFFVRLATLPYHTALHPANECEYPLGLYRPGDCAPWLKDPVPLSLSGFRRQALVTGGWIGILP